MGWFAPEERGLAIRQTAVPLGGSVASGVLPTLATHVSVRSSFFALAVGCFAASLVAAITFAAIVHHASWRLAFALAALSPLAGYAVLSPLSERRS